MSHALRPDFSDILEASRTRRGMRLLHWELYDGKLEKMAHKVMAHLTSEVVAAKSGFTLAKKNQNGVEQDRTVAVKLFKLALGVTAELGMVSLHYTHGIPNVFVALLHPDHSKRISCLEYLKECNRMNL